MGEARYWREIPQRYRMEAGKCEKCGKVYFPPRIICSGCKNEEFETINLSDEGKIISYTVIHTPPTEFFDESPYAMGIIELDDGVSITAQIADCGADDLEIGKRVKVVFRKIRQEGDHGIKCYGYKCVLVD